MFSTNKDTEFDAMNNISRILKYCQRELFPTLEDDFGVLDKPLRDIICAIELTDLEKHVRRNLTGSRGRPLQNRSALARAFIAKAVLKLPDTRSLLRYLKACPAARKICGWYRANEVPSESTFSRAFAEFAHANVAGNLHKEMILDLYQNRIVGHISRDSTDIHVRERPQPKPPTPKHPKRKVGRPRKGEERPPKEPTRLERQPSMSLSEMLDDLPKDCNVGSKTNSKGKKCFWIGYRFHVDFADGEIPISCVLTSASVHDSQVAIPLSLVSSERVKNLYDLMDAAYDMEQIHEQSRALGHVPIIDHNPRRQSEKLQMDPAKARRYNVRTTAERGFSRLKDSFGARSVRVRGHTKVFAHLMFGVLALTIDQISNLLR